MKSKWLAVIVIGFAGMLTGSCVHDTLVLPEVVDENPDPGCASDGTVCFESSVLPIFVSSCAITKCHNATSHREGYVLDTYANILKRGISPGNANGSKLYKVLFEDGDDRMPPDGSLTTAQKDSIRVWINEGAKNTVNCNCYCDPEAFTFAAVIEPLINNKCVGCHKPGSLSGKIDLSTYAKIKAQADNGNLLGSVSHDSGFKPMPEGGKLSDCEITQISKWIEAGALDN